MLWEVRGTRGGKAIRAKVNAGSEESARRKALAAGVEVTYLQALDQPSNTGEASAPSEVGAEQASVETNQATEPEAAVPGLTEPAAQAPENPPQPAWAPVHAAIPTAPSFAARPLMMAPPIQYAAPPQYSGQGAGIEKISGLAIASLVLGCVSAVFLFCAWFISWLVAIIGVVLGIVAWVSAKKNNNRRDRNMAMAGTFTSAGVLVLFVCIVGTVVFLLRAVNKGTAMAAPFPSVVVPNPPPAPPTPKDSNARLTQIEKMWRPSNTAPMELLETMAGDNTTSHGNGVVELATDGALKSVDRLSVPVRFRIIFSSSDREVGITYGDMHFAFNSERNGDALIVEGGGMNGLQKPRAGRLRRDEWTAVELIIHADEMTLIVDGKEQLRGKANFSSNEGPLAILAPKGGVKVKSVKVVLAP